MNGARIRACPSRWGRAQPQALLHQRPGRMAMTSVLIVVCPDHIAAGALFTGLTGSFAFQPQFPLHRNFALSCSSPAQTLIPLPVSRNDFMLESTRGQPQETFSAMTEPALNSPCVTFRRTMSSICSISKVTRELSAPSAGLAQVSTSRLKGMLSNTSPTRDTVRCSSSLMCCHFEPFFPSEIFSRPPQYRRVNSGSVMAAHSF